ncbi:hypothetical protein [Pedobacter endophyticus]|uniref:Uncharacterized protein n=1 Tax=Pedobacter endophyticus TaxID=2789740 RepID=A0A7U3Q5A2_9SPHI|nr:hypothetical protein [Pedobacter endophyticus]QPH38866.1 hypothetical protein IZT61_17635 [Pedobacter endophyticus]
MNIDEKSKNAYQSNGGYEEEEKIGGERYLTVLLHLNKLRQWDDFRRNF